PYTNPTSRKTQRTFIDDQLIEEILQRIGIDDQGEFMDEETRTSTPVMDCGHVGTDVYVVIPDIGQVCKICGTVCPACRNLLLGCEPIEYSGIMLHPRCYQKVLRQENQSVRIERRRYFTDQITEGVFDHFMRKLTLRK
ncbi:hypothetical protein ACFL6S_16945, partial [Candidatus Poribacteria bacterium]